MTTMTGEKHSMDQKQSKGLWEGKRETEGGRERERERGREREREGRREKNREKQIYRDEQE